MTRDLDLVRDLLLRAEREEFSTSDPNIVYHIGLLKQAGLVHAIVTPKQWRQKFSLAILKRLTNAGRDFLSAARNEQIWVGAKRNFVRPGLLFSLSLIAEYLKQKHRRTSLGQEGRAELVPEQKVIRFR